MIAAAMKLNMMVVMTTCEPRLACSQPGMKPQSPPTAAPATMAIGKVIHQGRNCSGSATAMTPRPAI
ncbi:hypothetical protein D3C86_2206500 [compost metagenome]